MNIKKDNKYFKKAKTDLIGRTFGRLTVVNVLEEKHKSMGYKCECVCSCGKLKMTGKRLLLRKQVKSCGCLNYGPRKVYL